MGNFLGDKKGEVTSSEEGLSEVGGVGVEIIRIAAHMPTLDGQKKGMECLVDEA